MKKTVTINISGIIFHIDEDAFERLSRYLESIKRHFRKMEGYDEVIADIESRIAEVLSEKLNEDKQVITIEDIGEVITVMGQPSEMDEEEENEPAEEPSGTGVYRAKRIYRDGDSRIIAGVASGLANYFNVDPVWIRILFVVSLFISGAGLIAYIILWIVVPEAITTSEKLEMRGEPVTIPNISKSVREEFDTVKGKISELTSEARETISRKSRTGRTFFDRLLELFMMIVKVFFKVLSVIVGIFLIIAGLTLILGILASITGLYSFSFFENGDLISFSIPVFLQMVFSSNFMTFLAIASVALIFGLPLILMVYLGFRLLIGNKVRIRYFGITILAFWLGGLVLAAFVALNTGIDFRHAARLNRNFEISAGTGKPIYFDTKADPVLMDTRPHFNLFDNGWFVKIEDDQSLIFGKPEVEFEMSENNTARIRQMVYAKGSNRIEADKRVHACIFEIEHNDSTFFLPTYFRLPQNEIIRGQQVKLIIEIPKGQIVKFSTNMKDIDIRFIYREVAGTTWIMTDEGLMPYIPGATIQQPSPGEKPSAFDISPALNNHLNLHLAGW